MHRRLIILFPVLLASTDLKYLSVEPPMRSALAPKLRVTLLASLPAALLLTGCAPSASGIAGSIVRASPLGQAAEAAAMVSAVSETRRVLNMESPAAGTYRVTYSMGSESSTVYVRTYTKPLVPSGLDDSNPFRYKADGYLLMAGAAHSPEKLPNPAAGPAAAANEEELRKLGIGGGMMFVFDRQLDAPVSDRTFRGMFMVQFPEGIDPLLDRINQEIEATAGKADDRGGTFTMRADGSVRLDHSISSRAGVIQVRAERVSAEKYSR